MHVFFCTTCVAHVFFKSWGGETGRSSELIASFWPTRSGCCLGCFEVEFGKYWLLEVLTDACKKFGSRMAMVCQTSATFKSEWLEKLLEWTISGGWGWSLILKCLPFIKTKVEAIAEPCLERCLLPVGAIGNICGLHSNFFYVYVYYVLYHRYS